MRYARGAALKGFIVIGGGVLMIVAAACASAAEGPDDWPDALGPSSIPVYAASNEGESGRGGAGFHLSLEGSWMYGPVDGFVQTPSGGQAGTTSHKRPKLDEMGIDHASVFDAEAIFGWGRHELYLGGQWVRLSGDDTLGETLVSQANTFPAGSAVEADVQFDWYRFGYQYRIDVGAGPGGGPQFLIVPSVGVAVLDFSFHLSGVGSAEVDRSYAKAAPQVGLEVEWRAMERFSIVGEVSSTLPFSNMPWIATGKVVGKYRFIQTKGVGVAGFGGVAYEHISYQDNQDTPNDIKADLGPMVVLGIEVRF